LLTLNPVASRAKNLQIADAEMEPVKRDALRPLHFMMRVPLRHNTIKFQFRPATAISATVTKRVKKSIPSPSGPVFLTLTHKSIQSENYFADNIVMFAQVKRKKVTPDKRFTHDKPAANFKVKAIHATRSFVQFSIRHG
jgi:hypothetical protein